MSPEAGHSGARLTGLPRKVKDTCADWHNYVQEWDVLNTRGMQLITEICNAKIAAGLVYFKFKLFICTLQYIQLALHKNTRSHVKVLHDSGL